MSNIVKGVISEVAKKEKSYKVVIDGKNYYSREDLTELSGKMIEAEYTLSEPYDFKGKQVQSKFLPERHKIAVLTDNGGVIHNLPEKATYGHQNAGNDHSIKVEPDWEAINAEKRRSIALSYSIELINGGKIPLTDLYKRADEISHYMKTGEIEVPF